MSYNWKCCSFYPNNFDASALEQEGEDACAHESCEATVGKPHEGGDDENDGCG